MKVISQFNFDSQFKDTHTYTNILNILLTYTFYPQDKGGEKDTRNLEQGHPQVDFQLTDTITSMNKTNKLLTN